MVRYASATHLQGKHNRIGSSQGKTRSGGIGEVGDQHLVSQGYCDRKVQEFVNGLTRRVRYSLLP